MSGNIVQKIRKVQKQRHDTLYCDDNTKAQILNSISGNGLRRADNLRISGLEVITHERFDFPIVCEKGEVFTLAKDFKCGHAEPIDI